MNENSSNYTIHVGDAQDAYDSWPRPDCIISDGAYGVRGFHGDTTDEAGLQEWYLPHIKAWTEASRPGTVLWFWGTEVGWATVHPELRDHGWDYVQTVTWDKGLSHIAGNVNGRTIRRFPVVTEVCVMYQRRFEVKVQQDTLDAQAWLRNEWKRSGLPMYLANEACGVKNAATRKYLTSDWLWYWPPGEAVEAMAEYCNENGFESKRPYFSLDGIRSVRATEWDSYRYPWNHVHGLTNVWTRPPLHDRERMKGSMKRSAPRVYKPTKASTTHLNQKPLELMERIIHATTGPGDVVWEPFGGLGTGSVAAVALGRKACFAELDPYFAELAGERLVVASEAATNDAEETYLLGGGPDQANVRQLHYG
ncbi:DNA methyltransferase [Rothia koreensis]|uniref:DNA methyltransferase n=1 Tax=Rothia koreensis TaxID=592378 RepID=UPI003FCE52A9